MSWQVKRLEEIASFNLGKMLDDKKNKGDPLPYLANINVRWGEFELNDLRLMRFETSELERFSLKYGDIVMCEGGEPGRCAIWKEQLPKMMYQKALHRIRPHEGIDNQFLYYAFLHKGKRGGFSPLFTGSTIKHLPKEKLAIVEVEIPEFLEQQRIATLLSKYDDLIENNKRRIELLEDSARQLYKEWFVRFRFPGHEHVKIIDGVPEGWKKINLLNAACPTYGFAFKSELFSEEPEGFPLIRIRDVPDRESKTYTLESTTEDKLVADGDFLIGMDGDFHMNFWAGGKAWLNQRVVKLEGISPFTTGYIKHAVQKPIQDFNQTITGTTVRHLGAKHLKMIEVVLPAAALLDQANSFFEDVRNQVVFLSQQNRSLNRARDLLLPKLMSGDITV
ncbi:MAG: restriction endonuclease subunit S [Nitrosomonas oligotropha]|uniref:Restriction endonuclease subunit S n=1 Tax=Nitrosomonas oligotropha TaxID=42354 RepID=A0A5C7VQB6_9PROT|nr:MAG: restriction endonuclease subunit S [Nitrosomonas oligotropha]